MSRIHAIQFMKGGRCCRVYLQDCSWIFDPQSDTLKLQGCQCTQRLFLVNHVRKKYLKILFIVLWGKIAGLEYEGLSLGVKHSSSHGPHCYREACGSDWGNQLRAVWRTGWRLQGQHEVDVVIPGLKAEVVEAEDGLAGSVSTDWHCQ